MTEDTISELDRTIDFTWSELQKENILKKKKKNEQRLRDLLRNSKRAMICIIRVSEGMRLKEYLKR